MMHLSQIKPFYPGASSRRAGLQPGWEAVTQARLTGTTPALPKRSGEKARDPRPRWASPSPSARHHNCLIRVYNPNPSARGRSLA